MHKVKSPEEKMFDKVACFLYKGTSEQAQKEFCLHLFAEWSKSNLDVILKALTMDKTETENNTD